VGRRGKGWKEGGCEGMDVLSAPWFVESGLGEVQLVVDMMRMKLLMIMKEFELPPNVIAVLGVVLVSRDGFNDVTITYLTQ
jgi:hypothetical protein